MTARNSVVALLVTAVVFCAGCSKTPPPEPPPPTSTDVPKPPVAPPPPAAPSEESAEDKTVLAVSKAIRTYKLSDREDACLAYRFDDAALPDAYVVDVLENHRHAKCGGDPNTAPRLFTVRVAKSDGAMSTDQGSKSGEFRKLSQ